MKQYKTWFKYNQEELAHQLMPQMGTVYTIVIEKENLVTDFVSFYNLPNKILNHESHKSMNSAYLYYYGC